MTRGWRLYLLRTILVLTSSLLALLLCEVVTRVVSPLPNPLPLVAGPDGLVILRPDTQTRFVAPGLFRVTVTMNSQGFRSQKELRQEPAPDVMRIAVLGDSFTFGWAAEDNETYPARLEQTLSRILGGRPVEVINAGVPGLGTGEKALYYDLWVSRFRPQVVILTALFDDVDDDLSRGPFALRPDGTLSSVSPDGAKAEGRWLLLVRRVTRRIPGYRSLLLQRSQFFYFVRVKGTQLLERLRDTSNPSETASPQERVAAERRWQEGLRLTAEEVRWLAHRVHRSGGRLVVVLFPARETIYPFRGAWADEVRWKSERLQKSLHALCLQEGIAFLDPTLRLREEAARTGTALYLDSEFDDHPTPAAYRALAEEVAKFLIEQGLVRR